MKLWHLPFIPIAFILQGWPAAGLSTLQLDSLIAGLVLVQKAI
jgi:hypothetical protein